MRVTIDPMVEDYLMRDEWVDHGALLQHANQWTRLFYQELQEMQLRDGDGKDLCDHVTIERDGAVPIGDLLVDCLVFTLEREGFTAKAAWFPCEQVQSRHNLTQELLFRGTHFINGVLLPLATQPWLEEQATTPSSSTTRLT